MFPNLFNTLILQMLNACIYLQSCCQTKDTKGLPHL